MKSGFRKPPVPGVRYTTVDYRKLLKDYVQVTLQATGFTFGNFTAVGLDPYERQALFDVVSEVIREQEKKDEVNHKP